MKAVSKPIECVCWFEKSGVPHPVRFRYTTDQLDNKTIKIDKVKYYKHEKLAGNPMIIFECQSLVDGVIKNFQIKYEIQTLKWFLFKI